MTTEQIFKTFVACQKQNNNSGITDTFNMMNKFFEAQSQAIKLSNAKEAEAAKDKSAEDVIDLREVIKQSEDIKEQNMDAVELEEGAHISGFSGYGQNASVATEYDEYFRQSDIQKTLEVMESMQDLYDVKEDEPNGDEDKTEDKSVGDSGSSASKTEDKSVGDSGSSASKTEAEDRQVEVVAKLRDLSKNSSTVDHDNTDKVPDLKQEIKKNAVDGTGDGL